MLRVRFGRSEETMFQVSRYFDSVFEREWFDDDLVRKMVKDVDKSDVIGGAVIDSPVLGLITPRELSGGVKTLILMLFEPENEYYATACGDNCGKWMVDIGKRQDVTISLTRPLRFRSPAEANLGGLNMVCLNSGKELDTMIDFINAYLDYAATRGDIT